MTEVPAWPPTIKDLERLYLVEKLSAAKIAKIYGLKYKNLKVAESTVLYHSRGTGSRGVMLRSTSERLPKGWSIDGS